MLTTTEFIKVLFEHTSLPVYICSFANERNNDSEPGERHVVTRVSSDIDKFVAKWDRAARGLFFCVGTINGGKRAKEHVAESPFLFVDIDFKDIDLTRDAVEHKLLLLPIPPTLVVFSGGGLHAYWLLKEPLDSRAEQERIETALRQLADYVGGDLQVCEIARVMRLPGTHNTKNGAWTEVEVLHFNPERRYELSDIEETLSIASPVILRKSRQRAVTAGEVDDNPFLRYARERHNFKPPLDVEQRLNAMIYMGGGDAAIHATQIAVSASLLNAGEPIDTVVDILVAATKNAAGEYGARWNWRREERAIRQMCESWLRKHPPQKEKPELRTIEGGKVIEHERTAVGGAGGAGGAVVQFPAQPQQGKKKREDIPAIVAGGVVSAIRKDGRDIMLTEGEMWIYEDGVWHPMSPAEEQWIRVLIQQGFEALGEHKKTSALNGCWKILCEHPELLKRTVAWADDAKIVCANGVLDIDTREFAPHGAHWFARRKIGTAYELGATCPKFLNLLRSMLEKHADTDAAMRLVQEWFGAALAIPRLTREQRKALLVVGKSRSGKTELSTVARMLIGDPIASPSVSEISETFGMQNFVGKFAWIRDDAVNEGDKIDPQRFKVIVTGEPIAIRRMATQALETRLQIPVLLTANSLPRARDHSDALYNRSIVLALDRVITEEEAIAKRRELGVKPGHSIGSHVMEHEASGVLNWALDGLRSLLERGLFELPESVSDAVREFKEGNNPIAEWVRSALVKSPSTKVERGDLLCAYHGWQREQEGEEARASGGRWFFPKLRAAMEGVGDQRSGRSGARFLTGLALNDEGLHFWTTHKTGQQLKGGSSGFSTSKHEVNRVIYAKETDDAPPF